MSAKTTVFLTTTDYKYQTTWTTGTTFMQNKFAFSLAYSYLFVKNHKKVDFVELNLLTLEKLQINLHFLSLIRTFACNFRKKY